MSLLAWALIGCDDFVVMPPQECDGGSVTGDVTWYQDVQPIVETHCQACHSPGNIAPFPLMTYADARPQAAAMKADTQAHVMPPWPPDDACNAYDKDRMMTAAEIATIAAWADGCAPEGDAATQVHGTPPTGGLSRVDVEIGPPQPYTPATTATVHDDYRCFLVDWPVVGTTHVTGFKVEPDARAEVHHVIAYLALPEDVAAYEALDPSGAGWTCFGGPSAGTGAQASWLGAWVPGSLGDDYPAGTGIRIPGGSKIIVQMHYNTDYTEAVPDNTMVQFKTDDTVAKEARIVTWLDPQWPQGDNMLIPAGESRTFTYTADNPLAASLDLWAVGLHMHALGESGNLIIGHANGSADTCALDIPSWDYSWQGNYFLSTPEVIGPNDTLSVSCTFTNTRTEDVAWGEGTADEMCLGTLYGTLH